MEELPFELIDKIAGELDDLSLTKLSYTSKLLAEATEYIREKKRDEHKDILYIIKHGLNSEDQSMSIYNSFDDILNRLKRSHGLYPKIGIIMNDNIRDKYLFYHVDFKTNTITKKFEGDWDGLDEEYYDITWDPESEDEYIIEYIIKTKPNSLFSFIYFSEFSFVKND